MKDNILLLNENCNQDCIFCFNDKSKGFFLDDDIIKEINKFSKTSKQKIIITGGEPLLHPSFFKFLELIKTKGFKEVILQSNGVLLTKENLNRCKDMGVTSFLISFHSANEESFDKITRTRNKFSIVINNINSALELGVPINISYVINNYNCNSISEDMEFISTNFKGIDVIEVGYNYIFNKYQKIILPQFWKIERSLHHGFEILIKKRQRFFIAYCGLPLCYLSGFEHMTTQAVNFVENNKFPLTNQELMVKTKKCKYCFLEKMCYGVQKKYLEIHGDKDIYPVFIDTQEVVRRYITK